MQTDMTAATPAQDPDAIEAARQVRRLMAIVTYNSDRAALIPPGHPVAHAYAIPHERREPGDWQWTIVVDECPYCGGIHVHDGAEGLPLDLPFGIDSRSAGLYTPPCSPWSFWDRPRASDGTGTHTGRRSVNLPAYSILIDLAPPRAECQHIPSEAQILAMMALPSNAGNLALESEVD